MTEEATPVWRLLPFDSGDSARHFAFSDALARVATTPTVWWHATDRPTLILGAGQRWEQVDVEACRRLGVRVVKRQAGGTSVFATPGVYGLDVFLPTGHPLVARDVVEGYRWLGEVWQTALQDLGVAGHLVSVAEARSWPHPSDDLGRALDMACFGSVSPYEVTVDGRKLVGLAQVRRRTGALLQAGIHTRFDPETLATILVPEHPGPLCESLRKAAAGLDAVAPEHVDGTRLFSAFEAALTRLQRVTLQPGEWDETERRHAADHPVEAAE